MNPSSMDFAAQLGRALEAGEPATVRAARAAAPESRQLNRLVIISGPRRLIPAGSDGVRRARSRAGTDGQDPELSGAD